MQKRIPLKVSSLAYSLGWELNYQWMESSLNDKWRKSKDKVVVSLELICNKCSLKP